MTASNDITMIPAWVDGTLRPVEKLAAHLQGLRHKAVSVFVVKGDALLIQQRALGKYHTPGLWANTCCTHPHWGEAALDCALRRLAEEMGITGLHLSPRGQIEYRARVGDDMIEHEVVDVFCAEASDDLSIAPHPDEVMNFEWIALDALSAELTASEGRFVPWLKIYMEEHRAQIFSDQPE